MICIAERINNEGLNKFFQLKAAMAEAGNNFGLLDLSIGEPPLTAGDAVSEVLYKESLRTENRVYADNGCEFFAEAAKKYFSKVYGCAGAELDFLPVMGAKSVLAMLPAAFINPGDVCLMPDPAYPVLGTWSRYMGGTEYKMHLRPGNSFYPDFSVIPQDIIRRAKLLYLNYPNNPTGQVADQDFFKSAIDFAIKNNILIVHDCAYGEIVREGITPLSIFSVPGAESCAIELHSLSKTRNMTGWRIGFTVANQEISAKLKVIKSNTDSGQFIPVQIAAARALEDKSVVKRINALYSERLEKTAGLLNRAGLKASIPPGTFYLYVPVPEEVNDSLTGNSVHFTDAADFCNFMIRNAGIVAVPWDNYFRLSMTLPVKKQGDEWFYSEFENRLRNFSFSDLG